MIFRIGVALVAGVLSTLAWAAQRPPNIVLLLADDLGYADVGYQGMKDIPTPAIDSIAGQGARFTDGYATHSVCSPSRAGLLTGLYQHRFGFENNSGPERYAAPNFGVPRHVPMLAEKLSAAGYATGMIGKWHVGFGEGLRPHERGFGYHYGFLAGASDYFRARGLLRNGERIEPTGYLTDAFAEEAATFIARNRSQPFFLYVAFNAVHVPLQSTDADSTTFAAIADARRRTYAGMLAAMDRAIGRVLGQITASGLDHDTLVLFYSDNGGPTALTSSRNDPLRGIKGQLWEGGIRVPFAARWPGRIPAGLVYREMVMGFDYHATAIAAAGLDPQGLDGVDLMPYLSGARSGVPHRELFWRQGNGHAARVGPWKLVRARGSDALFNLAEDIGETRNLAASRPDELARVRAAYDAWDAQMMAPQWIRQDRWNAEPGGRLKPVGERGARDASAERLFERADENRDGELSPAEFSAEGLDANADGVATLDEVRAWLRSQRDE